ncbi:CHC2 zinc finger domain-containing protein [Streptosporangium minutum]|uniref:CHC2 zinc finger domain-containing protein n=1 Tax=Streptosporangium minutum TaxID=569862 RepID=UPI0013FDFBDB|nr:CHC2 zinc finger domain-containing protein [Streptosporangium minutum]
MINTFSDREIFLIQRASPIDGIVSDYVPLHRTDDGHLAGPCPFQPKDSTHEIKVLPQRGLWICFGCVDGGDVIGFIRKRHNLTYVQAAERLLRELDDVR